MMTAPRPRGAVLVTGSASGIGAATALRLAADGHDVVAVRTLDNAAHLTTSAGQLEVRPMDVTDEDAMRTAVAEIVSDHSGPPAVIHNAGVAHLDVFETESMSEFRRVFEINFLGAVALTKLALPHLRASRGRVIALSSVGGVIGQPFTEAYCSAKFALEGLVEATAPVLRSEGVLVSLIEPGPVLTNGTVKRTV